MLRASGMLLTIVTARARQLEGKLEGAGGPARGSSSAQSACKHTD
jgi:hypothetical protein